MGPRPNRVAVATTSGIAAEAGRLVAEAGGNAVDAALAAALVTINTEPGVCSLGCGGFVTVWSPGERPVTIDGWIAAPAERPASELQWDELFLEYGGGVTMIVGPASVGVPGGVAAIGKASRRFGRTPWNTLLAPSVDAVTRGFPLPAACHAYLEFSGEPLFSRTPDGHRAIHDAKGRLLGPGDIVRMPDLPGTLTRLAEKGPDEFYSGDIGHAIAQHVSSRGGRLDRTDMLGYEAIVRDALTTSIHGWEIGTAPVPSLGGAAVASMLRLAAENPCTDYRARATDHVAAQHAVLAYRRDRLDHSVDLPGDVQTLLELAEAGDFRALLESPSTVHTSAADSDGLACAVTMSSGYGSGEVPRGTGIWLNNCLGELELNVTGVAFGPAGARLPSNMSPTVARHADGRTMAIGSPGADRITTALMQVMLNVMRDHMRLPQAIAHPRVHVEHRDGGWQVAFEEGADTTDVSLPVRHFPPLSMFFGGVGAVLVSPDGDFEIAADPRRTGGVSDFVASD